MTVNWIPNPIADGWADYEEDVGVWVSVAALDASFRRGDQWIGPGGAGKGQAGRYANMGATILSGVDIRMSTVSLGDDGEVRFTDGRHRFAWVRDHGAEAVMVATGRADAAALKRLFATDLRVCRILAP